MLDVFMYTVMKLNLHLEECFVQEQSCATAIIPKYL